MGKGISAIALVVVGILALVAMFLGSFFGAKSANSPEKASASAPITKSVEKSGDGSLNWQAVPDGTFSSPDRVPVVVREVDTAGQVAYYYPRWMEVGQTLDLGKGVGSNQDRAAWMATGASINDVYLEAFSLARAGVDDFKKSFVQIECASLMPAIEQMGYETFNHNFVRISATMPGDDSWANVECSPAAGGGVPDTETPMPAAPTATTVAVQPTDIPAPMAQVNCGNVSAVMPGTTVSKGTWVVFELVDYSLGTVQVSAGQLNTDATAGAQASNPLVHINLWTGYCSQAQADWGAADEVQERTMESKTQGNWANGYIVTKSTMP